jgi:flagellar biosynthesis chaperone FliJ
MLAEQDERDKTYRKLREKEVALNGFPKNLAHPINQNIKKISRFIKLVERNENNWF